MTDNNDEFETADPVTVAENSAFAGTILTTEQKIRVECLKIVFRHDKRPQELIKDAADYEAYILKGAENSESDKQG